MIFLLAFLSMTGWGPFSFFNREPVGSKAWLDLEVQEIDEQADNIDPKVLRLGLIAYAKARQYGLDDKQLVTIIDYSKPSTDRRLWVLDLKRNKVLFNTWVAHGKNSGILNATSFSNRPGSLQSSLGVFLTTNEAYMGENGYSLRLQGLEDGINNNAYNRAIVIHGAWYANPDVVKQYGSLGRSWGCPAVSEETARPLIDLIKDNTLVFSYYPDSKWLTHSPFLVA